MKYVYLALAFSIGVTVGVYFTRDAMLDIMFDYEASYRATESHPKCVSEVREGQPAAKSRNHRQAM